MVAELKPCPCCNGKAVLKHGQESWGQYYAFVKCEDCGLRTRDARTCTLDDCKKIVVISWNRRATNG